MTIDGTMEITRRMFRVTTLLLFLFLAPIVVSQDEEEEQEQQYLYAENAGVVIDYMPSPSTGNPLRPDFLYSPYNGPRMVEFYAPWCPHCQEFRDHFVQFSGQMAEAALSVGVDDFEVYAISCEVHRSLCKNWEIKGFPQMRLFQAGHANYTAKASYWKLNPNDVLKQLGIPAKVGEEPSWVTEEKKKNKVRKVEKLSDAALAYNRTQVDVFNDAHLSFHFALRNGIYMTNGPLSIKTSLAFERWLKLLDRALPPRTGLHLLVSTLLKNFQNIIKGEEHLLAIAERMPPPTKRWSLGCTHGKKGAGYTCGLWELFHMVTVGVAERNQLSLIDLSKPIGVADAAETIRDYIENFFGCEVCRMNFVSAFDSCAHDRCTRLSNDATTMEQWRELPLWLFETHNSVNVRLLHEKGERQGFTPTSQEEIDKQWPARDDCPQCWRDDGGWVEDNAVAKLKGDYW
jgi:thiol oxidase